MIAEVGGGLRHVAAVAGRADAAALAGEATPESADRALSGQGVVSRRRGHPGCRAALVVVGLTALIVVPAAT